MKKFSKSLKALLAIVPTTLVLGSFSTITSCSYEKTKFKLSTKSVIAEDYRCSIDLLFSNSNVKTVHLSIVNCSSDKIKLLQSDFSQKNGVAHIVFAIDYSVQESCCFDFDLDMSYKDPAGARQVEHFTGIQVLKVMPTPSDTDRVECETLNVTVTNEHIANFRFAFFKAPQSKVSVQLLDDQSEQLYLTENEFEAQKHPDPAYNVWYVTVPVHLQMYNYLWSFYPFKLSLTFTNSYHKQQTNEFMNTYHLIWDRTETVPEDYYEIDANGVLSGIKPTVSPLLAGHFRTLDIPDNVTEITQNAFTDDNWLKNIRKIVIPNSVKKIGEHAFNGCDNLFELDLSSYEGEIPTWLKNNIQIVDTENLSLPIGYFWYGGMEDDDHNLAGWLKGKGFTDDWVSSCSAKCTPADFFSYEDSKKTIIDGISEDYSDYVWYYSVIRIPEQVTTIKSNAFDYIRDIPYFKDGRVDQPQTRRLILNRKLADVAQHSFNYTGIAGSIYIPCTTTKPFNEGVFDECNSFSPTSPFFFMDELYTEPLEFVFDACNNMEELPKNFAKHTQLNPPIEYKENPVIYMPHNLKTIGDMAFWLAGFNGTIKLPNTIETIGSQAFAPDTLNGDLVIPNTCKTIGFGAFSMHNFQNLTIPSSVETINNEAFGCQSSPISTESPHHSLKTIDISDYKEMPKWLDSEENQATNKNIFLNGCADQGVVYVSIEVWNDTNLRAKVKAALETNGVPSGWGMTSK